MIHNIGDQRSCFLFERSYVRFLRFVAVFSVSPRKCCWYCT